MTPPQDSSPSQEDTSPSPFELILFPFADNVSFGHLPTSPDSPDSPAGLFLNEEIGNDSEPTSMSGEYAYFQPTPTPSPALTLSASPDMCQDDRSSSSNNNNELWDQVANPNDIPKTMESLMKRISSQQPPLGPPNLKADPNAEDTLKDVNRSDKRHREQGVEEPDDEDGMEKEEDVPAPAEKRQKVDYEDDGVSMIEDEEAFEYHEKRIRYSPISKKKGVHKLKDIDRYVPVTFASNCSKDTSVVKQQTKKKKGLKRRIRTLTMGHKDLKKDMAFTVVIRVLVRTWPQEEWSFVDIQDIDMEVTESHKPRVEENEFSLKIYDYSPRSDGHRARDARYKVEVTAIIDDEKEEWFEMEEVSRDEFKFSTET